jgi:hypothetical protein
MSGQISGWFCNELLKTAFNRDTYTPPYTALLVALTLDIPPLNVDVTQLNEPLIGGYARVSIPYNSANWVSSGIREVATVNDTTFPLATDFWGTVYGYVLLTSEATPRTVAVGALVDPYRVISGVQPQLPAGSISFGLYD